MTPTTEKSWYLAQSWAINTHSDVNHLYDGKPYSNHLVMVDDACYAFLHMIPADKQNVIRSACALHDTIEDCRVTFNDLAKEFGAEVAEIVYAVTNEKGRNRKERANDKYYQGIRDTPGAAFVKICDRIANVKHSKATGSTMLAKYRQEHSDFIRQVDPESKYLCMWQYLESIFNS